MNEQWEAKRDRAPGTVIAEMDALRERALAAGALGAVSLGRGRRRVRARLHARSGAHPRARSRDVRELRFGTDPHGCVAQATPFPGAPAAG